MCGTVLYVTMVVLGVDVGWQPLPEGGLEYIIQIEPHVLEALRAGEDIASDIPPNLRGVRSYRITVGTDELPQVGAPLTPPADVADSPQPPDAKLPDIGPTDTPPADPFAGISIPPTGTEKAPEARPAESGDSPSDSALSIVPQKLQPAPDSRPLLERPVTWIDQQSAPNHQNVEAGAEATAETKPAPQRPWWPLTFAVIGLFGSTSGMLYLGLVAWDYRGRYLKLLQQLIEAGQEPKTIGTA